MISECRSLVVDHINELLHGLFVRLDDELFKHSERAESNAMQSMYFDAMRYMRREKESMTALCLQSYLSQYDDFWENAARGRILELQEKQTISEESFALVENETLEEDLAVNAMIGKGINLFHSELFPLSKRFAVLRHGSEDQIGRAHV